MQWLVQTPMPPWHSWSEGTDDRRENHTQGTGWHLLSSEQQYTNCEIPDVQAGFRKGRRTRDQIANICWIIEKQECSRKTSISALLTMPKPLTVNHNKLWKILQEMGIPDHLTCLLRNLYAGQEPTIRTGHGTTDWFQIGKGVHQGCILSPCLLTGYHLWYTTMWDGHCFIPDF